jgi:sortase A
MTITDPEVADAHPATSPSADAAPTAHRQAPVRKRVIAISVLALVVLVVAVAAFALFEGPFASSWYRSRQRALAADWIAPHKHTGRGHAIAVLQIPKLGTNVVVAEGDAPQQLRGGPGHREGTPLPGDLGNSVISGHHEGWGGPFAHVETLQKGDFIVVQAVGPQDVLRTAVFKVDSIRRLGANDPAPFARSSDFRVTLVTGRGGRFSDDRLVVSAVSGAASRRAPIVAPGVPAETSSGSLLLNASTLIAVLGLGGALVALAVMRRRYGKVAVGAVVVPLATIGLFGALFTVDLWLPTVR